MKLLLFIALISTLYSRDLSKLKAYKQNNPTIEQEKKKGQFILRFKDINTFDFSEFEKIYNVKFSFCIADGICTFNSLSKSNTYETLTQMRQREDLISVDIYKKYNMLAY